MKKTKIQQIDHKEHKNLTEVQGNKLIAPGFGNVKTISTNGVVEDVFNYDGNAEIIISFKDKEIDADTGVWNDVQKYGLLVYKNNLQIKGSNRLGNLETVSECSISDNSTSALKIDETFLVSNSFNAASLEAKVYRYPEFRYRGFWRPDTDYEKGDVVTANYLNRGVGEDSFDGFFDIWVASNTGTSSGTRTKVKSGVINSSTPSNSRTPEPYPIGQKPDNMTQAAWDSLQPSNFNLNNNMLEEVEATSISDDNGITWVPFRKYLTCSNNTESEKQYKIKAMIQMQSGTIATKIDKGGLAFFKHETNFDENLSVDLDQLRNNPTGTPDIFYPKTDLIDGIITINRYQLETENGNSTVQYEGANETRNIETYLLEDIGNIIIENYMKKYEVSISFKGANSGPNFSMSNVNPFIHEEIVGQDVYLYYNHDKMLYKVKVIQDDSNNTEITNVSKYEFPENVENICILGNTALVVGATKYYEIDLDKFDKLNGTGPIRDDIISINGNVQDTDVVMIKNSKNIFVHYNEHEKYKISYNFGDIFPDVPYIKDVDYFNNHLYILNSDGLLLHNSNDDGVNFHLNDMTETLDFSFTDIQYNNLSFGGTKQIESNYSYLAPDSLIEENVFSYKEMDFLYVTDETDIKYITEDKGIFARINDEYLTRKFISVNDNSDRVLVSKSKEKYYINDYRLDPNEAVIICNNAPYHKIKKVLPKKFSQDPNQNTKPNCKPTEVVPNKLRNADYITDIFRDKKFLYNNKKLVTLDTETGDVSDFINDNLTSIKVHGNKLFTTGKELNIYNVSDMNNVPETTIQLDLIIPKIAFANKFFVVLISKGKKYNDINVVSIVNLDTNAVTSYNVPVTYNSNAYIYNNYLYLACDNGMRVYDMNMNLLSTYKKSSIGYNKEGNLVILDNVCVDVIGDNDRLFAMYEPNKELMYLPNDTNNYFNSRSQGVKGYNTLIDGKYVVHKDAGLNYLRVNYRLVDKTVSITDNDYEVIGVA